MNTPSILKFGGGYSDKIELVVDPNTVIIGNHTGIFKNIDWNTLDYWHLVQCVLKEFVFKIITIDRGSSSWLTSTQLKNINVNIQNCLHKKGVFLIESTEYQRIHPYMKHFELYTIYIKNKKDVNLEFSNFIFFYVYPNNNILEHLRYKITNDKDLTYMYPEFNTLEKRKKIAQNALSLKQIYQKIVTHI